MSNIITSTGIAFGASNGITTLQDANLGSGIRTIDAAGITTGMAFLEGELEKRDPKIREPLTSVTWQRDIVAETGGGWVDFTSTICKPQTAALAGLVPWALSGTITFVRLRSPRCM